MIDLDIHLLPQRKMWIMFPGKQKKNHQGIKGREWPGSSSSWHLLSNFYSMFSYGKKPPVLLYINYIVKELQQETTKSTITPPNRNTAIRVNRILDKAFWNLGPSHHVPSIPLNLTWENNNINVGILTLPHIVDVKYSFEEETYPRGQKEDLTQDDLITLYKHPLTLYWEDSVTNLLNKTLKAFHLKWERVDNDTHKSINFLTTKQMKPQLVNWRSLT